MKNLSGRHDGSGVQSVWKRVFAAVIVVFTLASLTACGGGDSVTVDDVIWQLKNVRDWVGVEYRYKDVDTMEREKFSVAGVVNIPFTGNKAIIIYEGVMKYGIDASQIEVAMSGDTIILSIPEGKMISHEILEDSVDVYDPGNNIFRPFKMEDMNEFRKNAKAKMEQEAIEKGLPNEAREKAAENLREFLQALPGMDQYTLEIRYK